MHLADTSPVPYCHSWWSSRTHGFNCVLLQKWGGNNSCLVSNGNIWTFMIETLNWSYECYWLFSSDLHFTQSNVLKVPWILSKLLPISAFQCSKYLPNERVQATSWNMRHTNTWMYSISSSSSQRPKRGVEPNHQKSKEWHKVKYRFSEECPFQGK